MKIKKKAAIAATFLTVTNFSACSNFNQDVYGPPVQEWEMEETDTESTVDEDAQQSESEASTDNSETTEGDDVQWKIKY